MLLLLTSARKFKWVVPTVHVNQLVLYAYVHSYVLPYRQYYCSNTGSSNLMQELLFTVLIVCYCSHHCLLFLLFTVLCLYPIGSSNETQGLQDKDNE